MFEILISEAAKDELQNKNESQLDKIYKSIENLRNGLWGNGTRVKKLHAVNKSMCIYEARIDKARRLLFSIKSDEYSKENPEKSAVFIHNLYLEHDKVILRAKGILGSDFDKNTYNISKEKNKNLVELLNEEKNYKDQYEIYFNIDCSKKYVLTEEEYLKFFNKSSVSKKDIITFQLKLTSEQEILMNKPLPLLIAGTAGSGKTTIAIYKLKTNPGLKKLYITSSNELCMEAKKLFTELVNGDDNEEEYKLNTEFKTFDMLLQEFKKDSIDPLMTKVRFISEYMKYGRGSELYKKFPALMIWEEIRGIWKSGLFSSEMELSENDYIKLKEEQAPNFKGRRKEAYKIFLWYKNFLAENFMVDELDLIQQYLNFESKYTYSMVACDEVQDLTNMHLKLIYVLVDNNPQRALILGDDHQIVNHSGFRWENITTSLYKNFHLKVRVETLNKNFRNTGKIVKLANSINKLQEKYTEYRYRVNTADVKTSGDMPKVCKNISEEEFYEVLNKMGPTQSLIVRNSDEQEKLLSLFKGKFKKSPLIFTLEQCKGLEFDTVVLWKINTLLDETKEFWIKFTRRADHNLSIDSLVERCIRYESSLLYVAITRGMKKCLIYDGVEYSPVWNMNNINENVEVCENISLIKPIFNIEYSDYDWFVQGKILMRKKLYRQAIQCFERVNNSIEKLNEFKTECRAQILIEEGNLDEAANLYLSINSHEKAAECYDNAGLYEKAANLYISKQYVKENYPLYRTYMSKHFDSVKEWYKSAIYCKQEERFYEAAIRFERAERCRDAGSIYENYLGQLDKAIECYTKCTNYSNKDNDIKRCADKKNSALNRVSSIVEI